MMQHSNKTTFSHFAVVSYLLPSLLARPLTAASHNARRCLQKCARLVANSESQVKESLIQQKREKIVDITLHPIVLTSYVNTIIE